MALNKKSWLISAAILLVTVRVFGQAVEPAFSDYSVKEMFTGKPALPKLLTPFQRTYRTQIRSQAKEGPNFAGHFTIAKWGCGTVCQAFVIIDARTGLVYEPGFSVGCEDKNGGDAKIDFLRSSALLATSEMSNGNCGTKFYKWDGGKLTVVAFIRGERSSD